MIEFVFIPCEMPIHSINGLLNNKGMQDFNIFYPFYLNMFLKNKKETLNVI